MRRSRRNSPRSTCPAPRPTLVDRFAFYDELQADPGRIGLTEVILPCLFPSEEAAEAEGQPVFCGEQEADRRFFFDNVHPSGPVHAAYAEEVRETILAAPIPVPGAGLLLLGGLGGLLAFGGEVARRALTGRATARAAPRGACDGPWA